MKLEENVKKGQKKLARAKRHDAKRAKRERTKRSRPSARKARQEAKKLRDVARAGRRKEKKQEQEASAEPEEEKSKRPGDHKNPFYNEEVRQMMVKVLTRASFKPVGKRKGVHSERRENSGGQSPGWKPGKSPVASEEPQVRKPRKMTNSTVTKLLKAAMKLTADNREERSEEESSEEKGVKTDEVEETKAGELEEKKADEVEDNEAAEVEKMKADEVVQLNSSDPTSEETEPGSSVQEFFKQQGGAGEEFFKQQGGAGEEFFKQKGGADEEYFKQQGLADKEFLKQQGGAGEEFFKPQDGVLLEDIGPDLTSDEGLTTTSTSENELESGDHEERTSAKKKFKRCKKRASKNLRTWVESSDDDEEMETERRCKANVGKSELESAGLTETSDSETVSSSEEEDPQVNMKPSTLKGGGNQSLEEAMLMAMLEALEEAIARTGLPLKLDKRTPAKGNCFPISVVQQCQRPQVKAELERQGKTVTDYMALRKDVRQFVMERQEHPRIKEMKENFEQKQLLLAYDGEDTSGWFPYWKEMTEDRVWVDDTFVQATAYYLGLPIFIVPTGSATYKDQYHPISGDFESDETPFPGPSSLWIGYINDQHYQSLLRTDEGPSMSGCPSPEGVDEALRRAFAHIQLELFRQRRQVGCFPEMILLW